MSFVRLDSGEFPPLGSTVSNTKNYKNIQNGSSTIKRVCSKQSTNMSDDLSSGTRTIDKSEFSEESNEPYMIKCSEFIECRVGLQLVDYTTDLRSVLEKEQIGELGDFIITPIEPTRLHFSGDDDFALLPDLILDYEAWNNKVAIELRYPSHEIGNLFSSIAHFERVFRHALYLPSPVIIISFPDSDLAVVSLASIINKILSETSQASGLPKILFKVPIQSDNYSPIDASSWIFDPDLNPSHKNVSQDEHRDLNNTVRKLNNGLRKNHAESSASSTGGESGYNLKAQSKDSANCSSPQTAWKQWNTIRSHLHPDLRIGVCLSINNDISEFSSSELNKWNGEPVHLIILHVNQFSRSPGHNSLRLMPQCLRFIRNLTEANSLRTSLAIEGSSKHDVREYFHYLKELTASMREDFVDFLRNWDDKIQPPLQPLSVNLCSGTYSIFETDMTKYIRYREAMKLALQELVSKGHRDSNQKYILMVLGAGRGPLVDAFIQAIKELDLKFHFKIFALDKNQSSVQSLRYKQKYEWHNLDQYIETEVIESDMRTWEPGVKADIIASELLGSLGDNELSPECLDGTWKLATPETICIPQAYQSFIAPICSYKLHQVTNSYKQADSKLFDRIYVTKLTNYYPIDAPAKLFHFFHKDMSLPPSMRDNTRYQKATFWSRVDTVCHGLSGYFSSRLFGKEVISTVPHEKTIGMQSWFPIFIPFEKPIQMPRDTKLEIHFWRKESLSSVWYEWVVTSPERTRIYGQKSTMSKFI